MLTQETKMTVYEIVRLFRFYYVDKIISKHYPKIKTWKILTGKLITRNLKKYVLFFLDEWSKYEMKLIKVLNMNNTDVFDEKIQNDSLIVQFLSPIEKEVEQFIKFPFKLLDLRKMSNDRHSIAHQDVRSICEQRTFIAQCQQVDPPKEYEHIVLVKHMVKCLATLDAVSVNTKLQAFR